MEKNSKEIKTFSPSTNIYNSPFPSHPLPPSLSLPSFLLHSPPHPSRPAFVSSSSPSHSLSFSSLSSLVSSVSRSLSHSLSILPKDIVLLVSPNSILFPAISLGIIASGAVLSTANPLLTRPELLSQIELSPPALILTTASLLPKLQGLTPRPPLLIHHLLQNLDRDESEFPAEPPAGPEAALMFSSGTTGRSKGVVCTHRGLVHEASVMLLIELI